MSLHIITTGGTIDKVYFDAAGAYEVGEPQIVGILKVAGASLPVTVDTLMRKDSLELTDADRAEIVKAVTAAQADRIIVTHGTDTMVETARALTETLGPDASKTVVFVGSLTPARFKASDAEFNVGFATAAAQILPPGVYITMNGSVFRPHDVRKNRRANRFEPVAEQRDMRWL